MAPPTARSDELRVLAQRVADALPPEVAEEVVLTGSTSRGVADELSDVEMLVVSAELPGFHQCMAHARAASLVHLDTWSRPGSRGWLIGGRVGDVSVELVWWSRAYAEGRVAAILAGEIVDARLQTAEALAHGLALRTVGLLADWQERLRDYPSELAAGMIEEAAQAWGGYQASALLTITRPGERLPLVEWLLDDASRVLRIVFALNRAWEPTHKRLPARVEPLAVKPPLLGIRIESALVEPDPRRALLGLAELAAETVALAPSGPYVDRARTWLAELVGLLR